MNGTFDHVIIGGGVASAKAIEALVRATAGRPRRIALISADREVPYHRPPLSKGYLLGREKRESVFVKPRAFYEQAGVTLLLSTRVTAVNPPAHAITTNRGETIGYRTLLIATGCTARRLAVPGSDLSGILTLRTLADCETLRAAVRRSKTAVVIGGSFIGMELASAFAQSGLQTTLLHRGTEVFDKLGSREASAFFARYYAERGVTIRTEDEVVSFEPFRTHDSAGAGGLRITTKQGDALEAGFAAVGIGVTPDIAFLDGSGIAVDTGIVVNEYLESSVPGVYAAGDVAKFFDPLYKRHRRVEHWDTAMQHGTVAGTNMAAADPAQRKAYDAVSYFYSDVFDLSFEYFGDAAETTRTVMRGTFDSRAVTLFFLQENIVRAAFTMGRPRERKALIALIRAQRVLETPEQLSDPAVPLPT